MVYLLFYIYPLPPTYKLEKYVTIYFKRLIYLERSEAGVFFVILIAMFVIKKTGFKIGQEKISPLIITVTLHFQQPKIFIMR